jgi:hypothetical protein
METGADGFAHVAKDRYEYAMEAAAEEGREEPNAADELEGFRRMIDCAMDGGDTVAARKYTEESGRLG